MLQVQGLKYSYDGKRMLSFPDFSCERGENWLILGNSGCGKTTLLHLLSGLLTPSAGKLLIDDTDISKLKIGQMDRFRGQKIGLIFQKPHFVESISVQDNILLAQHLAGRRPHKEKAAELLRKLEIAHKAHVKTYQLSQGEQQRVAIARAIINQPSVILADEPTSALDDQNTREVIHLLLESARAVTATLLIVTHDQRLKEIFPKQIHLSDPVSN